MNAKKMLSSKLHESIFFVIRIFQYQFLIMKGLLKNLEYTKNRMKSNTFMRVFKISILSFFNRSFS